MDSRIFHFSTPAFRLMHAEELPAADGHSGAFEGVLLGVHHGSAQRVTQRRAGRRESAVFTPGQLTLIEPDCDVRCWTDESCAFLHIELPKRLFAGMSPADALPAARYLFDDPLCRQLAAAIHEAVRLDGETARVFAESAAQTLALRLLSLGGQQPQLAKGGLASLVLARVIDYMQASLADNPGVAELAQVAGLSPHHFARMFRVSTGQAPHQYLQTLRMERAKSLLRAGTGNMLEIAQVVGFATASHFAAFFRRHTGLSPRDWQRAQR
ncbi:MAG: AraC family transcriptional regulator [Rhodocyclaceae bacterium]